MLGGSVIAPIISPRTARAQQAMPVIGYVDVGEQSHLFAAFQRGLVEAGYIVGRNVAIELRSAGGRYDRLPELVADLVKQQRGAHRNRHHAGRARSQGRDHDDPNRLRDERAAGRRALIDLTTLFELWEDATAMAEFA
jgi:hypothetical protein